MIITKQWAGCYRVSHPNFNSGDFGGHLEIYKSVDFHGMWRTSLSDSLYSTKREAVASVKSELDSWEN